MAWIICEIHGSHPVRLVSKAVHEVLMNDLSTKDLIEVTHFNEDADMEEFVVCLPNDAFPLEKNKHGMHGLFVCEECYRAWIEKYEITLSKGQSG